MANLEAMVKKDFPNFETPHLPTINLNTIGLSSMKLIESRKILIEDFL